MSASKTFITKSFIAAGIITKYDCVYLDVNAEISTAVAETQNIVGIAQSAAVAGDRVSVIVEGDSFAIAADAIIATDSTLMPSAGGLKPYVFGVAATPNRVIGRFLPSDGQKSVGIGELFRINVSTLYFPTA